MLTAWGDGGAEASLFSVLPTIYYTALLAHGKELNPQYKKKFAHTTGVEYDDFMLLDKLNRPENKNYEYNNNKSFMYFYNDVLHGIIDSMVQPDAKFLYTNVSDELRRVKSGKELRYVFTTYKAFCDFVAEKSTLGKKAYEAYIAKEMDALKQIVKRTDVAIKLLDNFIEAFAVAWHIENKTFGFEKHQMRLGGLKLRLEYARDKINLFCKGKIPVIEEFECERMPVGFMGENPSIDSIVCIDVLNLSSGGGM
jgi:hypothetical protein